MGLNQDHGSPFLNYGLVLFKRNLLRLRDAPGENQTGRDDG